MRVLVIQGYSVGYWALWEHAASLGVEIHTVGALDRAISPTDPRCPQRPNFGVFHEITPRRFRSNHPLWWRFPGLRRVIDSVRPDVVHVRTEPWSLLAGQAIAAGRPTVIHGAEMYYEQKGVLERSLRRGVNHRNLTRLSGFVGWNPGAVGAARCAGLPMGVPVSVVPAEIPDHAAFGDAQMLRGATRKALGFEDEFVVGFVGRYVPEKGIARLLDAFDMAAMPNARLAFFGAGPSGALVRDAERRSDGRVRDFGHMPLEDVPKAMAALDVLAVPSVSEPEFVEQFGRVAVEAMLVGTPVIASRSGFLPELISGCGVVVDEDDTRGLSAALRDLAEHPERCDTLGRRGRDRVMQEFSPSVLAERLVSFWERVPLEVNRR